MNYSVFEKEKEIILKKADKGTTTVVVTKRENKINEGQIKLDDRNNYQVRDTFQRVEHLINSLRQAGCIDEMTAKWFNSKHQIRFEFQCSIPSRKFTNRH